MYSRMRMEGLEAAAQDRTGSRQVNDAVGAARHKHSKLMIDTFCISSVHGLLSINHSQLLLGKTGAVRISEIFWRYVLTLSPLRVSGTWLSGLRHAWRLYAERMWASERVAAITLSQTNEDWLAAWRLCSDSQTDARRAADMLCWPVARALVPSLTVQCLSSGYGVQWGHVFIPLPCQCFFWCLLVVLSCIAHRVHKSRHLQ